MVRGRSSVGVEEEEKNKMTREEQEGEDEHPFCGRLDLPLTMVIPVPDYMDNVHATKNVKTEKRSE